LSAVVIVVVALNFGDGGPIIKVVGSFAKGVVGGGRASEEVKEQWGHGLSNFFIEVVGGKEEVNSIGLLIVVLAHKKADMAIGVELDPLGLGVVSVTNGDLGGDSPSVVLITVGSDGKLKVPISLA
jgi:hypothetical protein